MEDFGLGTYQNIRNNQTNPDQKGFNNISFHDFGLHKIDNKGTDYSGKASMKALKKDCTFKEMEYHYKNFKLKKKVIKYFD